MPPTHEEEALPQVRDAIVKEVEELLDRGVPSLLKEYSAAVLHPMKRDLQRAVQRATKDAFRVKRVVCRFKNDSQILALQQHDQILSCLQESRGGKQVQFQTLSKFLSPQQHDQILSCLQESRGGKQVKLELLYRASRDS
jgi:hypothetical protein